jgi:uncharacterized protein YxjI
MLLDNKKFVVKASTSTLSDDKSFEILDEGGKLLATTKDVTTFFAGLLGGVAIEVRDADTNELIFTLARSGFLMKKDEVKDGTGEVVGRFKAKKFTLSGGYQIYDKAGKHVAEIQGKMFKAEYKFLAPDKNVMGTVSRTWAGLAKEMLTGDNTYGVEVQPAYAEDSRAKLLMLGAAIAAETIFKREKKESDQGGGGGGDD